MCDYSLHNVASRPARIGDNLVIASFPSTCTRGFAAVGVPAVAVCLLPGTEIAFDRDVDRSRLFAMFRPTELLGKLARFRQINQSNPHTHHDALEFPNGKVVLLTQLTPGQRAKVLQLPANSEPVHHSPHPVTNAEANPMERHLASDPPRNH